MRSQRVRGPKPEPPEDSPRTIQHTTQHRPRRTNYKRNLPERENKRGLVVEENRGTEEPGSESSTFSAKRQRRRFCLTFSEHPAERLDQRLPSQLIRLANLLLDAAFPGFVKKKKMVEILPDAKSDSSSYYYYHFF